MKEDISGFTLIELMFTVAILAILLMVAAPSFDDTIRRNAVESQQAVILSALNSARQEAVNRATPVSICRSTNGTGCAGSGGNWNTGWIIFTDGGTAGSVDGSDAIVRVQNTAEAAVAITLADAGGTSRHFMQFNATGALTDPSGAASSGVFKLCDRDNVAQTARAVVVASSGRPAQSIAGTGGIHMNSLASPAVPLSCP